MRRAWLLLAVLFLLVWVEFSAGEQRDLATRDGKPVLRCFVRGRVTGITYTNYICQRGGGRVLTP